MSSLGAFAFAGMALTGWMATSWWMGWRNDRRLAASRPGMTRDAFVTALGNNGADGDIAEAIFDWIALYYGRETTPNACDRMKDDICIDPGDIEFFMDDFFKEHGILLPTIVKPDPLPDYAEMTLTSLAIFLTQKRAQTARQRS